MKSIVVHGHLCCGEQGGEGDKHEEAIPQGYQDHDKLTRKNKCHQNDHHRLLNTIRQILEKYEETYITPSKILQKKGRRWDFMEGEVDKD